MHDGDGEAASWNSLISCRHLQLDLDYCLCSWFPAWPARCMHLALCSEARLELELEFNLFPSN